MNPCYYCEYDRPTACKVCIHGEADAEELADALAALRAPAEQAPEVKIRVTETGRIFLHIGIQSFLFDFQPEDEPDFSARASVLWMADRLRVALSSITPCVKMEIAAPSAPGRTE